MGSWAKHSMIKDYDGHSPKVHSGAYISERSLVIGSVYLAEGVSVWPGCVLRADIADIIVKENSNLQDGVLIHTNHDQPVLIGAGVTVGHGAILHGCRIADNCLIGMGSIILDGAVIGERCIIGAGSVVTEHMRVPDGQLVLGVPGKIVRPITEEEIERIKKSAVEYVGLAHLHNVHASASPD